MRGAAVHQGVRRTTYGPAYRAALAAAAALAACDRRPPRDAGRDRAAMPTPGTTTGQTRVPSEVGGDPRRGAYVAQIAGCVDCHTPRGADGVTPVMARAMTGGVALVGPWGTMGSANVTEFVAGLPDPTVKAAIRGHLGSLGPMPTAELNTMAAEDMRDLVAYLRTLKVAGGAVVAGRPNPAYVAAGSTPRLAVATTAPAGPTRERGLYLVTIAGCSDCHTPTTAAGAPDTARHLAGGGVPPFPQAARYRAPNITPDSATGIGAWSAADVAAALREGRTPDGRRLAPFMPWATAFRAYTDTDVAAVAAYLRSLPPVRHAVPPNPAWPYAAPDGGARVGGR